VGRRFLVSLLVLTAILPIVRLALADDDTKIERKLARLYLGDSLRDIKRIYKPIQEWPSYVEPRGHVNRYRVERSYLKNPDSKVDIMWLGMKGNNLVEIQLIYDAQATKAKSAEALAGDFAIIYGEPRLTDGRYWWSDGRTVLRVFNAEVPVLAGSGNAVELRTSIQVMDEGVFERVD
jgi:hypothetical protein